MAKAGETGIPHELYHRLLHRCVHWLAVGVCRREAALMWFSPNPEYWTPPRDVVWERYCPACACMQSTPANTPCWNCGGETTTIRPAWWPFSNSGSVVINGKVWGPEEEEGAMP